MTYPALHQPHGYDPGGWSPAAPQHDDHDQQAYPTGYPSIYPGSQQAAPRVAAGDFALISQMLSAAQQQL